MANEKRTRKETIKRLRSRAEKLVASTSRDVAEMPMHDMQKLVHELQVHQIELEMQNDELRRTQAEPEAARPRLLLSYDAAPVGFLTLDAVGDIREANLAAAGLLNLDRIKLTGQKLARFVAPESRDDFSLRLRQLFRTGEKQTCELHLLPAGRPRMIARLETVVERTGPGRPARCLALLSDITAQKQAEARLAAFAAASFEGITESEAGRILDCNEQYARMVGRTVAEVRGMEIAATIAPEDRERVMANIQQGRESVVEHGLLRKDGTRLIVEAHGRPLPGSARRHSALRDITARKQAEAALREREEQWRLFVDHAPAAIAMFDTQMRYLAVSQRWLADYGFSGQDILGRGHYDLFPEIPARWEAIHRRCLAGAVERADEDAFTRADGRVQWIRWEIQPWKAASGAIGGIIIFSEDITARKQAMEALRASNEELTRFNRAAVGRELRMVELKREINALRAAAGQPPQFDLQFATECDPPSVTMQPVNE